MRREITLENRLNADSICSTKNKKKVVHEMATAIAEQYHLRVNWVDTIRGRQAPRRRFARSDGTPGKMKTLSPM